MARVSWVEFRERGGGYTLQHLLGEDTEQLPTDVQRFEHCAVLVVTLRDEVLLELRQELQIQQVVGCQGFLTHYGLHGLHVLTNGVASILKIKKLAHRYAEIV